MRNHEHLYSSRRERCRVVPPVAALRASGGTVLADCMTS